MVNLPTLSLLISGASAATRPALTDALISSVNQNPNHTWTAGRNAFFEHLSLAEATATLLRIDYDETTPALIRREKGTTGVGKSPLNFDSRTQFPGCIGAIRNQLHCGACWAFAAAEVLSDRFCIASNGSINVTLAPQDLCPPGSLCKLRPTNHTHTHTHPGPLLPLLLLSPCSTLQQRPHGSAGHAGDVSV